MRALVLDPGGSRSALAGCRALGQAGWAVGVASPAAGFAERSRFVQATVRVPPATSPGFIGALASVAAAYDVIVPAGDAELFAVSAGRDALPPGRLRYGSHEVVARALDKHALADAARSCAVAVPESRPAASAGVDDLPVVVKGRSHVQHRRETVVARTAAELSDARRALGDDALAQEFVDGPLVAMSVVADASCQVVARVQQRALAVWPVPAGVSTRAVTEAVDLSLAAAVDRVVAALAWQGLAQFQFVVGRDGVPRLIDCNGRLYGSLSLAVAAGVNLPAVWLGGASGATATPGVRYQWLEGDLRRTPSSALSSLAWGMGAQHSVMSLRDPRPALTYGLSLARRAARKVRR